MAAPQAAAVQSAPGLQRVATDDAPSAIGPYSQAIVAGGTVYVSGCIGMVPGSSGKFAADDVAGQAKQSLENMKAILEKAGSSLGHVVKTTVLLTDMAHYAEVRCEAFTAWRVACGETRVKLHR